MGGSGNLNPCQYLERDRILKYYIDIIVLVLQADVEPNEMLEDVITLEMAYSYFQH